MNLCLFGGTFDPIHRGHLEVAHAAAKRFGLHRLEFVVSDIPPHKQRQPITPYLHRYAMVALAVAGEKLFFPSTLEAPISADGTPQVHYSIETVRRVKQALGKSDRLFFLIGVDAFADISTWREPEALLRECEFIVVSRPGYSISQLAQALPVSLRPDADVVKALGKRKQAAKLVQPGVTVHVLENVSVPVSATSIRRAAALGRSLTRMVPAEVAEYIKKMKLYGGESRASEATIKPIK